MKKYTAVIIGTGRIGYLLQKDKKREQPASHSFALKINKRIKILAGCDLNIKKLKMWHKDYPDAKIYKNYIEMIEKEKPDIVVIAVNEINHLKIALKVIEYMPKLVILEKPAAPDLNSAIKIKIHADKFKVPILINHERRFSNDYIMLKSLLMGNKTGYIHSIHANLWNRSPVYTEKAEKNGACSLIHDGIHLVDIINFLFDVDLNDPVIDKVVKKNNVIKNLYLHYNIDNDKILYFDLNGRKKYFGFEIEIRTDSSRIIIGNGYFKFYESAPSPFYSGFYSLKKNNSIKRKKNTLYFTNMIKHCIDYLDKNVKLESTIEQGVKNIDALYQIIKKIKL